MSVTPGDQFSGDQSPGDRTYIRAGGGVELNPRRVLAVLGWIGAALLLTFAGYYAASGSQQSSNLSLLRDKGVPVSATVTGCVGISSGVGMGIEYWQCSGTYTLDGRSFNEVLNGSRKLLDKGQIVPAVAVPGHPSLLSTTSSVGGGHSSTGDYVAAAVLGGLGVVAVGGLLAVRRHRRREPATG